MSNRTQNYIRNSIWGIICKVCSILLPFVVRTVLIYKLGIEYVGLNTLFSTVLQVFSLAELGFGSALVVSMYGPIANNNTDLLCALLNFYKKIYRYIGYAIGAIGVLLLPYIPKLINGSYPSDINIYLLYLIYVFNTVSSYLLFAYKSSLLVAHQRNDIKNKIILSCNFTQNIVQIIVLLVFGNYYAYIIWLPIATVAINLSTAYITNKKYPHIKPKGEIPKQQIDLIKKQVISLVWHKMGNTIIFSFDNIIISASLGLVQLGIYNNYYFIFNSVASMFSIVYDAIIPGIGTAMITESKEKNYARFQKFDSINKYLIGICATCLLVLYQPFILLWQGKSIMLGNDTVYFLVVLFIVWHSRRMIHTFKDAAGLWEMDRLRPIVEAIVKLAINLILVYRIGINGVVISTIIVMLFVGSPWDISVFVGKYFMRSAKEYYIKNIWCFIQYFIVLSFISSVCSVVPNSGIALFVLKGGLCFGLAVIIFGIIYLRKPEFFGVLSTLLTQYKNRVR